RIELDPNLHQGRTTGDISPCQIGRAGWLASPADWPGFPWSPAVPPSDRGAPGTPPFYCPGAGKGSVWRAPISAAALAPPRCRMSSSRCPVNTESRPAQSQLIGSVRSFLCALCVLLWESALADAHYVDVNSTNATPP